MPDERQDFEWTKGFIPDDAIPTHGIRIIEYLDEDGDPVIKYRACGDERIASLIGLLQMVIFRQAATSGWLDTDAES